MNEERFKELMDRDSCLEKYDKSNVVLGLNIISKYLPKVGITGTVHDMIFSADIEELIKTGITEEDVIELANLNWHLDYEYGCGILACFV